jgi:GDPmannose 4,6-dehydratase
VNYREAYNLFACNGILFNHESPVRGETFVTRKITRAIPQLLKGGQNKLWLGNLDAKRDWGHAKDYVEAMWLMLQQEAPEDFVIATGKQYAVRDFIHQAFRVVDVEIEWSGLGLNEKGIARSTKHAHLDGKELIGIDPRYFRPTEVETLLGDAGKAQRKLGWIPKIGFDALVEEMVLSDLKEESYDYCG